MYDFLDPARDAAPAPEGAFSRWRVSVDYGTVNPLSMGLWGERDGVWYRVEEVYYDSRREGQQKTDAEYADMLERLAAEAVEKGASFISLYFGEDVSEDDAQAAGKLFEERCPQAEVAVLSGGQPVYYYIISME